MTMQELGYHVPRHGNLWQNLCKKCVTAKGKPASTVVHNEGSSICEAANLMFAVVIVVQSLALC